MTKFSSIFLVITLGVIINPIFAEHCKPNEFVYGANELVDQLLVCSVSKLSDLSFIHHGDFVKNTSKTLVEHGFENKTTVFYAKLNGLWALKRSRIVETGWRCEANKTIVNSIIQVDGLSLDVIERVDIPLHRNQHKLSNHKPCKTFDLPTWLCRPTKQLFKTTRTWVNSAYFNLTLTQNREAQKPTVEKLTLMFTCPETFKQKITYSPSAMYVMSKYLQSSALNNENESSNNMNETDKATPKNVEKRQSSINNNQVVAEKVVSHPVSFVSVQDGRAPAYPPYHSHVNLITKKTIEELQLAIQSCIQILDSDLSIMANQASFTQYKFVNTSGSNQPSSSGDPVKEGLCSSKRWILNRIELADALVNSELQQQQQDGNQSGGGANHEKRSQYMLRYPVDPNQLLNPYGYYHENAME